MTVNGNPNWEIVLATPENCPHFIRGAICVSHTPLVHLRKVLEAKEKEAKKLDNETKEIKT